MNACCGSGRMLRLWAEDLLFSLEPVIEGRSVLAATLQINFVGALSNLLCQWHDFRFGLF